MDAQAMEAIYNRLHSVTYTPLSADTFGDWTIEAGDILTVSKDGTSYQTPVMHSTLRWTGGSSVYIESTGNKEREPLNAQSKQAYENGYGGYYAGRYQNGLNLAFQDEFGYMRSYIDMTEEHLWLAFENDLNCTRSEFLMTSESLRVAFENEISCTRSEFLMTSESLRISFENDIASARSEFQMTAESLRVSFENDLTSMRSELQISAESLRTEFEDAKNSLRSEFQITAASLRTQFEDERNSLRSEFQITAASLRTEFEDSKNSLRSEFQITASSLRAEFEDGQNSLRSELQVTAASLRTNFENEIDDMSSQIEQNATQIALKVNKGDVMTQLAVEAGNVTVQGGNLIVEGVVTASAVQAAIASLDYVSVKDLMVDVAEDRAVSVKNAIYSVDMTEANGQVTLHFYGIRGLSQEIDSVTFNRAAASSKVAGTWSNGIYTVSSDPNGQDLPLAVTINNVSASGTVTYNNGFLYVPLQILATPTGGSQANTGYSQTLTVTAAPAMQAVDVTGSWSNGTYTAVSSANNAKSAATTISSVLATGTPTATENGLISVPIKVMAKLGSSTTETETGYAQNSFLISPNAVLEELTATANTTYLPSDGKIGFSAVTVNVPAAAVTLSGAWSNGTVTVTPSQGTAWYSGIADATNSDITWSNNVATVALNAYNNGSETKISTGKSITVDATSIYNSGFDAVGIPTVTAWTTTPVSEAYGTDVASNYATIAIANKKTGASRSMQLRISTLTSAFDQNHKARVRVRAWWTGGGSAYVTIAERYFDASSVYEAGQAAGGGSTSTNKVIGAWSGATYTVQASSSGQALPISTNVVLAVENGITQDQPVAKIYKTNASTNENLLVSTTMTLKENVSSKTVTLLVNGLVKGTVSTQETYAAGQAAGGGGSGTGITGLTIDTTNHAIKTSTSATTQSVTISCSDPVISSYVSSQKHYAYVFSAKAGTSTIASISGTIDATDAYNAGQTYLRDLGGPLSLTANGSGTLNRYVTTYTVDVPNGTGTVAAKPVFSIPSGTLGTSVTITATSSASGATTQSSTTTVNVRTSTSGSTTYAEIYSTTEGRVIARRDITSIVGSGTVANANVEFSEWTSTTGENAGGANTIKFINASNANKYATRTIYLTQSDGYVYARDNSSTGTIVAKIQADSGGGGGGGSGTTYYLSKGTWNNGNLTVSRTTSGSTTSVTISIGSGTPVWTGTSVAVPINDGSTATGKNVVINVSSKLEDRNTDEKKVTISNKDNPVTVIYPNSGYIGMSRVKVDASEAVVAAWNDGHTQGYSEGWETGNTDGATAAWNQAIAVCGSPTSPSASDTITVTVPSATLGSAQSRSYYLEQSGGGSYAYLKYSPSGTIVASLALDMTSASHSISIGTAWTTDRALSGWTKLNDLRNKYEAARSDSEYVAFNVTCGGTTKTYYMEP